MNPRILKLCAWSGVATLVVMGIGFAGFAHFIPPPSPDWSAQRTADFFIEHETGIRIGMILSMISASFLAPFCVAMTIHVRRIEGPTSPMAWIVLALGAIFVLEFIYLIFFWQTATFRTDRPAEIVETLNDMAWIPFVGLSSTLVMQSAVYGIAMLLDKRERPVFPRWLGYYNIWAATLFTPGSFNVFFKTGALAWNGLLAFYIPVAVFVSWLIINSIYLAKAVDHQVEEEQASAGPALEIAQLQAQLDRFAAAQAR